MVGSVGSGQVVDFINRFTGPWLYVVTFVITFAETGTMFFLIPGEIALLVAGAAAGAGDLNVGLLLVVACAAALLGDFTGFHLGDRFGPRLQRSWLGRKLGEDNWHKAQSMVQRRPWLVIIVGRWIGFLRAIMPASVGMSEMPYRKFLVWDAIGAISWASVCVIGGYKLGSNWESLANNIGKASIALLAVVAAFIGLWLLKKKVMATHDPA